MLLEQTLGHVTHSKNLRGLLPRVPSVNPVFIPIEFQPGKRFANAVGWSNWTVRAGVRSRLALRRLSRQRDVPSADVLFVHTQVPAVLLGSWLRRQPTVVSIDATPRQFDNFGSSYGHERGWRVAERLKFRANQRCFQQAAHVIAWSTWARQSLIDDYRIPEEKISVISPGVDIERWNRQSDTRRHDKLRVLFVGGDFHRKGGDLLLEAARRLRSEPGTPDFELHVVTHADVPPEPGLVIHRGVAANSTQLIEQYHAADIFCLPTRADCLAMVLVEAGAAGLPLISTKVAAIPTIVKDGETGLLVEPGDLTSLVGALRRLLTEPDVRKALGRAAQALMQREHDAANNAKLLADVFADVQGHS